MKKIGCIAGVINTKFEKDLWSFYYIRENSYAKVAWMFGVTRQAVCDAIKCQSSKIISCL
jgi:predicted DNA-binding protein YlxM (UPF0122 family)